MQHETNTHKRYKHIQGIQTHTRDTNTYKGYEHIQEIRTHTRDTNTYKRQKHIQKIERENEGGGQEKTKLLHLHAYTFNAFNNQKVKHKVNESMLIQCKHYHPF